ncbi:heme oxygenase (biliverdin-producing) [soil metagenome]
MERRVTTSLAERLKTETRTLHTEAERSPFMGELLRGRMAREPYVGLLRNLHAIYAALEPALARHADHAAIAPVLLPGLARTALLQADLDAIHGDGAWRELVDLQPAAKAYVARLQEIADGDPALLLAHAYVRYLGDLSGGQLLERIVANSMQLAPGEGTAFYGFGDVAHTAALKLDFRAGLGQIVLDDDATDAVVAEAVRAFTLHRRLFDELASAYLVVQG